MSALRAGTATDVGLVRANNQDSALVASPLFAVADGMGGHAAGEVASATACQALEEAWATGAHTPEALVEAARQANRSVFARAEGNPEMHGMGTTLVTVALTGGPDHETVAIAHVGDSRVYRLHDGQLAQVTADHSLVAELVADGQLAPEEAEYHPQRHVLSRALGVYPEVEVDLSTEEAQPGDRYLLCSDGLSREVPDRTIAEILRRQTDPGDAARELVDEAKANGGSDNVTVVIVDIIEGEGGTDGGPGAGGPVLAGAAAAGVPQPGGFDATRAVPRTDDTAVLPAVPPAPAPARKRRLVTVRLVAFILALLAVIVIAIGGIDFYARSSYYVGLQGDQLVIYQGRPGGVLWFHPTVKERTGVTTDQIEPRHLSELHAGMTESSLKDARQYVTNLTAEERAARGGTTPSTTTPSSTTTTPTTLPATRPTVPTSTTAPAATPVT